MSIKDALNIDLAEINLSSTKLWLIHSKLRERCLVMALVFFFIFVLLAYFVWKPKAELAINLSVQIAQKQQQLDKQLDRLEMEAEVIRELAQMRGLLPILKSSLPHQREIPSLLKQLHDTLLVSGMELKVFMPEPTQNSDLVAVTPVKLSLEGQGELIAQVPNLLLQLTRKVTLAQASLTRSEGSDFWSLDSTVHAYSQARPDTSDTKQEVNTQTEELDESKPALMLYGEQLGRRR